MLKWDFKKDKIGEWIIKDSEGVYKLNLYSGNALLIGCYEFIDEDGKEKYVLNRFFADKDHLKNCLGTAKGHDNLYKFEDFKLILDKNYKETKTIVNEFLKAKFNSEFEIIIVDKPF